MSIRLARQREEEAKAARQREASQIKVAEVLGREREGFTPSGIYMPSCLTCR